MQSRGLFLSRRNNVLPLHLDADLHPMQRWSQFEGLITGVEVGLLGAFCAPADQRRRGLLIYALVRGETVTKSGSGRSPPKKMPSASLIWCFITLGRSVSTKNSLQLISYRHSSTISFGGFELRRTV